MALSFWPGLPTCCSLVSLVFISCLGRCVWAAGPQLSGLTPCAGSGQQVCLGLYTGTQRAGGTRASLWSAARACGTQKAKSERSLEAVVSGPLGNNASVFL